MIIAELDALIARTHDAAMILLTGADWHATMRERPLVRSRTSHADHVVYRGLPVWLTTPGPSRVLSAEQVRAEGPDDLQSTRPHRIGRSRRSPSTAGAAQLKSRLKVGDQCESAR